MKSINVTLTGEQFDDICHALFIYEMYSREKGYEYMPEAIHKIRQYLLQHLDECFK